MFSFGCRGLRIWLELVLCAPHGLAFARRAHSAGGVHGELAGVSAEAHGSPEASALGGTCAWLLWQLDDRPGGRQGAGQAYSWERTAQV